jgi:ABC-2 type transport system ATP-binding protein
MAKSINTLANALTITNVTKTYPTGTKALHGVSLTVPEGGFYALLGPNGAGKTTLIGIVVGLVERSGGTIEVFGVDNKAEPEKAKSMIGIVQQEVNFNPFDKCLDVVVNQAGYYGIPRKIAVPRAKKLLADLGLGDKLNEPGRTLSGGMKRRLMIARALVQQPRLLILDEPTAGVDVELRRSMWAFLRGLAKQGVTIVLTTHYLEEAEQLCKNISIINRGRIVAQGSMADVLKVTRDNPHDKNFEGGRLEEVFLRLTHARSGE